MATPSYAPILGGTETCVRELSLALRARGHFVDVLTTNMDVKWRPRWNTVISHEDGGRVFRWGACNPTAGIRTALLNRMLGRNLDAFLIGHLQRLAMVHLVVSAGARRLARQYDIVHGHDEADLTFAVALRPHVMHLHTMSETFPLYRRTVMARHILRSCAQAFVANSEDSARRAIELGIPRSRLAVVPNGVNTSIFTPGPALSPATNLLFVGRLVPRKGLEVLLRALRHVATPVALRVVGGTTDEQYGASIRAAAAALESSSQHRVHFLGPRSGQGLAEVYKSAGIFVCPSLLEPFGIVALEAMTCQIPVIASRVDGLVEVIEHEETGLMFEPGDERDLAAQIERLLNDDALRLGLGCNGRERAIARFTWQHAAEKLERVYADRRLNESTNSQPPPRMQRSHVA